MCDYSQLLNARDFCTRRAKVGDELELVQINRSHVHGFVQAATKKVTCLRPGTEIAFAKPPFFDGVLTWVECDNGECIQVTDRAATCVARTAVLPGRSDGVEFPDGRAIGLNCLRIGERIKVLQLPVMRKRAKAKAKTSARSEREPV